MASDNTCARCGGAFHCGIEDAAPCACRSIKLDAALLAAIRYGLTPDDQWNARYNPRQPDRRSGWFAVFGVIGALMVGATVLIATIAFSGQRFFESQVEAGKPVSQ